MACKALFGSQSKARHRSDLTNSMDLGKQSEIFQNRRFDTRYYYDNHLIPSMKVIAKGEGQMIQAQWQGRYWRTVNAENQPTRNAFVLVAPDGSIFPGPKFDPSFLKD